MISQLQFHATLPLKLQRKIENELQPGELVKWVAQPRSQFFTKKSLGSFLFAIPWTAFALFWIVSASGFRLPDFSEGLSFELVFPLWGIPFMLVGLWAMLSPLREWLSAQNTVYLITDRRALSIQVGWSTVIRSYLPNQLTDVYRKERANGWGDVIITTRYWKDSDGDQQSEEVGFLRIHNPQEVELFLKQLAQP